MIAAWTDRRAGEAARHLRAKGIGPAILELLAQRGSGGVAVAERLGAVSVQAFRADSIDALQERAVRQLHVGMPGPRVFHQGNVNF